MSSIPVEVQNKLDDLCRAILSHPEYEALRLRVDQFMINDEARAQYEHVSEQGEQLNHKQMSGVQLAQDEITVFENERAALLRNPVARAFLDAQEGMHTLHESVNKFVGKTLELGRMPESGDMQGGCGHGCGCGHGH